MAASIGLRPAIARACTPMALLGVLGAASMAHAQAASTKPSPESSAPHEPVEQVEANEPDRGPLHRYLIRDLMPSARFLDHGVLGAAIAGGTPHLYRLELGLGVLDHITIGATAHWLPGQFVPGWSPRVAIAFWRSREIEVGASYHQSLYPPPAIDEDPETPSFQQRAHWVLGSVTLSQWWVTAGLDLGMVRAREIADSAQDPDEPDNLFVNRHRVAGGLHLRLGTRRFGITAQALWPHLEAEIVLDVRFGLFEKRARGGWNPLGPPYIQRGIRSY